LRDAFSLPVGRAVELLPILERTETACEFTGSIHVVASAEPGHLLYGPYIRLEPGRYQLEVSCSASGHGSSFVPLITIEIAAGDVSIAEKAFDGQDFSAAIVFPFNVTETTSAMGPRLEFRISHHAFADLQISGVKLRHLRDGDGVARDHVPRADSKRRS
jgi:hypothetical protein